MKETQLAREREITLRNIANKQGDTAEQQAAALRAQQLDMSRPTGASGAAPVAVPSVVPAAAEGSVGAKRRNRWDQASDAKCAHAVESCPAVSASAYTLLSSLFFDADEARRWVLTPCCATQARIPMG